MTGGEGPVIGMEGASPRAVRAWYLYDWANSAFATTVMAGFFPVFFKKYWASGLDGARSTALIGTAASVSAVFVFLAAVGLGAMADRMGRRRLLLGVFCVIGSLSTLALAAVPQAGVTLALVLYVLGMVGFAAGNVFYDALLPLVASPERYDEVSSRGFAFGYAGGGILLAVQVAMVTFPRSFWLADEVAAVRASFVMTGLWWLLFAIPLLVHVRERRSVSTRGAAREVRESFRRFATTLRALGSYKDLFLFLLAFWCYSDGVGTIIKMATAFGADAGIGTSSLMGALLLVQFIGVPASLAYGWLARRVGRRPMILAAICAYSAIVVLAYFMVTVLHFWLLAFGVALFQGGIQAISRSLFAAMSPPGRSAEFFGLYNVTAKLSTFVGPFVVGWTGYLAGNSRVGIFALLGLLAAGASLLAFVDTARGEEASRRGT